MTEKYVILLESLVIVVISAMFFQLLFERLFEIWFPEVSDPASGDTGLNRQKH